MNLKILQAKLSVLKDEIKEWVEDGLIDQYMAADMFMLICSELIRRDGVDIE